MSTCRESPADAGRAKTLKPNLAGGGDIEERRHVELAVHHVRLEHQLASRGGVVRLPTLAHLETAVAWDRVRSGGNVKGDTRAIGHARLQKRGQSTADPSILDNPSLPSWHIRDHVLPIAANNELKPSLAV